VAISVGSSTVDKRVPTTHWEAVGAALIAAGRSVTVLGGPRDPVPHIAGAENLVGKLSLAQSMEVAAAAQLHLSGDTGMGHIAAAYGVPTVSVFGPMPPERYRPYGARSVVLRAASKRPEDVSVEQILSACAEAGVALA
jgi:ADP-heptose:LPS heptosyltransferase